MFTPIASKSSKNSRMRQDCSYKGPATENIFHLVIWSATIISYGRAHNLVQQIIVLNKCHSLHCSSHEGGYSVLYARFHISVILYASNSRCYLRYWNDFTWLYDCSYCSSSILNRGPVLSNCSTLDSYLAQIIRIQEIYDSHTPTHCCSHVSRSISLFTHENALIFVWKYLYFWNDVPQVQLIFAKWFPRFFFLLYFCGCVLTLKPVGSLSCTNHDTWRLWEMCGLHFDACFTFQTKVHYLAFIVTLLFSPYVHSTKLCSLTQMSTSATKNFVCR